MEVDIINMFGFIFKIVFMNGINIFFKIIQATHLKNWIKPFANGFEL
jgi:hypothetical protein